MSIKRIVPTLAAVVLLLGGAALVAGGDQGHHGDGHHGGEPMRTEGPAPGEHPPHRVRGEIDHREARHLVKEGVIRPLSQLMAAVQARYPGRVLEAKLEREEDGAYHYEVELLSDELGEVVEVEIDAVTGEVAKLERED